MIFDNGGELLAKVKLAYPPHISLRRGWAEQRAEVYFDTVAAACRELPAELIKKIRAVSATTFRDTMANLGADGKPLRPVIIWLDERRAECKKPLPFLTRTVMKLIGMHEAVEVQRRVTKSNWIKENEPEIWQKTYKYVMISGYINYRLTGVLADSSASQIGHIPIDNKNNKWQTKSALLYPMFDIPAEKMLPLVPPGKQLGSITAEASALTGVPEGVPVIACGSDKGCETLGTGCIDSRSASLSFGTSATIQFCTQKYVEPLRFMPCYPALIPGKFNPEIQIYRGFWMLNWFVNEFAAKEKAEAEALGIPPEELLNRKMTELPPGSEGLLLQPYWAPSLKTPEGKGAVIGFSDAHTRIHLYRATLEGIGYALIEGMKTMEKRAHTRIETLTVSGGGAQSDIICQLAADMFGLPVYRVQTYETSGLGAAMTAFAGVGIYEDTYAAAEAMVHRREPFLPNLAVHAVYKKIYEEVYLKLYPRVQPLYSTIRKHMKESIR